MVKLMTWFELKSWTKNVISLAAAAKTGAVLLHILEFAGLNPKPIGSMYGIYGWPFTINIPQFCWHIYYTWILWEIVPAHLPYATGSCPMMVTRWLWYHAEKPRVLHWSQDLWPQLVLDISAIHPTSIPIKIIATWQNQCRIASNPIEIMKKPMKSHEITTNSP